MTRKAEKAAMPRNAAIMSLCWQLATHSGNGPKIEEKEEKSDFCHTFYYTIVHFTIRFYRKIQDFLMSC